MKPKSERGSDILIVDDADEFLELMLHHLTGHDVRLARSMKEAREMIAASPPGVILLDLTLPDSPSTLTLASIPDLRRLAKDAPIIIVTGDPDVASLSLAAPSAASVLNKDDGFFAKLSTALVDTGVKTKCAAQRTVEEVECAVKRLVKPGV